VKKPVSKFAFRVHNLRRYNEVEFLAMAVHTSDPFLTIAQREAGG
jgi:hypothetical protein